jgi:hypothetical protein
MPLEIAAVKAVRLKEVELRASKYEDGQNCHGRGPLTIIVVLVLNPE